MRECLELINVIISFNIYQIVKISTKGDSTLDLFLTTHPVCVSDLHNLFLFKDQALLNINLSVDVPVVETSEKIIRNFARVDAVGINANLLEAFPCFERSFNAHSVEYNWSTFKEIIHDLIGQYISKRRIIFDSWLLLFNINIKRMLRKKKTLFQYVKDNGDALRSRFLGLRDIREKKGK